MSDDARELRRIVVGGVLVIAGGAAALAAWAAYAPLSGAVIAPGFVKVDLNRKVVQHQEGGTVRAVRVRDGDRVKQGQELVVLDDVRVDAALDLQRTARTVPPSWCCTTLRLRSTLTNPGAITAPESGA